MKLSMLIPPNDRALSALAAQMGIKYAITKAAPELSGRNPPYDFGALKSAKDSFAERGLKLVGLEGDQFDMSPIKLGLPNRGEWIGRYAQMLRNMGGLGIRLLCLNWMASIGWFRTDAAAPARGGALTTSFDASRAPAPEPAGECVSEEKLRENLYYFLDAVLPEAEKAGVKMALHPDDPPVSPLCGISRILKSAEDYEKVFSRYDSKFLGATFCQATFKVAGENVKKLSADWIRRGKIFFIHIRDARGNAENFTETFIDEERGFVAEMLAHYRDCGFDGPIRSDHAPAMFGEPQKDFGGGVSVGYRPLGHIFSCGYIKGCCDALKIPLE